MSNSTNTTMDTNIWDYAQHINVPMNGHYNLAPGRSYTLGELYAMKNPLAMECKDAIDQYIIDPDDINFDQTPDIRQRRLLCNAFVFTNAVPVCPHCHTYISVNRLFQYHPAHPKKPPAQIVAPCVMNDATKRPLTYGINIPSGRLVLANDLRHLIYSYNDPFLQHNEQNNRRIIQAYANVGLLCLFVQTAIDIRPTQQPDSYVIGTMPRDPSQYADYIAALPCDHRPRDIHSDPLAYVGDESSWVHAMDGAHVERALARFAPEDAARIRQTFTTIPVAPGYYALTLESTHDIEEQQSAILARIDDGTQHPMPTVATFSMADAMAVLAGKISHKFNQFFVLHAHYHWALGCPTIEATTNTYSTARNFAPVTPDIPSLAALYDKYPNIFVPHKLTYLINQQSRIFADIPRNIAPEAIACWIAGADALMHAIVHHPHSDAYPAISQHTIAQIYREYEHFRAQLWGAACAHKTTDTVLQHIATLRDLIQGEK